MTSYGHSPQKTMAPHSSVPAWRISGTGEPGGLPSMELHRVGHDWSDLAAAGAWSLTQKHVVFLSLRLMPGQQTLQEILSSCSERVILDQRHWHYQGAADSGGPIQLHWTVSEVKTKPQQALRHLWEALLQCTSMLEKRWGSGHLGLSLLCHVVEKLLGHSTTENAHFLLLGFNLIMHFWCSHTYSSMCLCIDLFM